MLNYYKTLVKGYQDQARVKIQPEVLLKAARGQNGGAARLFFLAKFFNQSGSRTISARDFRRWLLGLGISRRVIELWLARALELELITRRNQWLDLVGAWRAYAILGCFKIYKRATLIPLNTLINKGWLAHVWAAYVKRFEDQPISQGKLRELTDIPERNQRQYERQAGVVMTRNIALDRSHKADQAEGFREFERPGAFAYRAGDCIAWGLPNSRAVPGVNQSNKGRNRKIKKELNRSCITEARDAIAFRIFHNSEKQLKASFSKLKQASVKGFTLPDWLYLQTKQERFWSAERI